MDFIRDFLEQIALSDDLRLFFRRRGAGKEDVDVHFAEQVLGFVDVRAGRILFDESGKCRARFRQFPFLPQLGGGLKLRQAQIGAWFGRDFAPLFLSYIDALFEDTIITKPGGAKNDDRKQQREEPLHESENETSTL